MYLAALWLRELDDPSEGVRAFAGSTRHISDYLTDEVLTALVPSTREFLLRTSVLGRFTPELCDAVLGRDDSAGVLADLASSNMFLVALDAREEWYRYHHLFGEVLQLELGHEEAIRLRRRAAAWCGAHGHVEDAIKYSLAVGDAEIVAELLEENDREFIWGGRMAQFLGWLASLPSEVLGQHPSLLAGGAAAAALTSRPEVETQRLLALAERARRDRPHLWPDYVEAVVEVTRAMLIEHGDVRAAVDHARRAVAAAHEGAEVLSVGTLAALAQALFFAGDLDETRSIAQQIVERPDAQGTPDGYVTSLGLLALIGAEAGQTESAEEWARLGITFAHERSQADLWTAAPAHLGLALAYAAMGRLGEAEREALCGERLRRSPQPTVGHAHALLVLAQVRVARSRLTRATRDLERAQRAITGFADPGRLPAMAATIEQAIAKAQGAVEDGHFLEAPSPAERAVLRELAAGLSRREIGERLYISLNTVKTHTRELYRKLGATSRADAIARAEVLGLLDDVESPG